MGYFMAWAVAAVFLMTMANFKSTEKLGAAFAYLILVAVLLANYESLKAKINGTPQPGTAAFDKAHRQPPPGP